MLVSHITQMMKRAQIGVVAACLAAAALAAPGYAASAPPYAIHPNDQLSVQVFGDPSLSQNVTVLPSGDITYPLIGSVHVAGQSPSQAATTISNALKRYVINPHVNVLVMQQGTIDVLVLGGVAHPGKVEVSSNSTFTDAIAAAGGLSGTAQTYGDAIVTDYAGNKQAISLQKIFGEGDLSQNVSVGDGATIFVPAPALIDIEVTGAVDHPGQIELSQGDRLSMAIAKAGNSNTADGDLNNIHITRPAANGQAQNFNINLYDELQHGHVDKDIVMQKGDVVFVPKSKHGLNSSASAASDPVYLLLLGARLIFPHI